MLNILQCTGQPPQQRGTWPQELIVPRLRSPKLGLKWTLREGMEKGIVESVVLVSPPPMLVREGRGTKELLIGPGQMYVQKRLMSSFATAAQERKPPNIPGMGRGRGRS